MCTSAHYLNNIPLVVFTYTLPNITHALEKETTKRKQKHL